MILQHAVTESNKKTNKKKNMKAAVTVQKTAHGILLYGFIGAEQELPLY